MMPPQQQSEEEKQLSRRGLRFGAAPFCPGVTAVLDLSVTSPTAPSRNPDAHMSMVTTDVPDMVRAGNGDAVLSEAVLSHSRGGGRMGGHSAFVMEPAAAASIQWMSITTAPSHHSSLQPSSIGRDDLDGDSTSTCANLVPFKTPALGVVTTASSSSNTEMQNVRADKPGIRRSALMVTNTATGVCISPATMATTPSGSPTAMWNCSGGSSNRIHSRTSGRGSGESSLAATATTTAATSPTGTSYNTGICSVRTPQGIVVHEFPQAPFPTASRTPEPHQQKQQQQQQVLTPLNWTVGGFPSTALGLSVGLQDSGSFSRSQLGQQAQQQQFPHVMHHNPQLLSESDLDRVQHNRVAVSDVVAKDEGTLVDTLFADVNVIEDDESEPDGDDVLSHRAGGERRIMQPAASPATSGGGSPFAASSPNTRTPYLAGGPQLQHRVGSFPNGARMVSKEAARQIFGGGYWYPTSPWAGTEATSRGSGSGGAETVPYRSGGDAKPGAAASTTGTANMGNGNSAAMRRGLTTPPHPHRPFSASCASVASTISLIDPKQPQADSAAYDMMGEDDEWEMNSSAYADSLDEAQIQWIEEQLRATENPAGYF
ncbi:hypothetical protein JKF63_07233 [Porcisia hertigi]|uniref:Uncharacterized protein n=1 Tax=Porcisia hertigi TaxID=2761500 RepID=A0A836YIV6_9TRYP|nr:hypothetical protein JKF63_07233 [Porcisia hertigi]